MTLFPAIEDALLKNNGGSRKRKYRYKTVLKGRVISKHFTKTTAKKAASKIRGAYFIPINTPVRKTRSKRRRTSSRSYSSRRRRFSRRSYRRSRR